MRHTVPERLRDVSVATIHVEVLCCSYIDLSANIPKLFIVHAEQGVFWYDHHHKYSFSALKETTSSYTQGIHTPVAIWVFEKSWMPSPSLSQSECQVHVCGCGTARETSRSFQQRNGKTCHHWSRVFMLTAKLSDYLTSFTVISFMTVNSMLWVKLNCRYNPF